MFSFALVQTVSMTTYVFSFAGINRFYDNLEMMYGFRINPYMKVSWAIISPLFCVVRILKVLRKKKEHLFGKNVLSVMTKKNEKKKEGKEE